jgi:hypothetical protein
MPVKRQITMPSFVLKLIDFPHNPDEVRKQLRPYVEKKSTKTIY